eukprot:gene17890-21342_t
MIWVELFHKVEQFAIICQRNLALAENLLDYNDVANVFTLSQDISNILSTSFTQSTQSSSSAATTTTTSPSNSWTYDYPYNEYQDKEHRREVSSPLSASGVIAMMQTVTGQTVPIPMEVTKKRGRPPIPAPDMCAACFRTETPEWRKGLHGVDLSSVGSVPDELPLDTDTHRNKLVKEMVSTERSYRDHLNNVIQYYLEPLRTNRPAVLETEYIVSIFSNIEKIKELTDEMLAEMVETMESGSENVAKPFLSRIMPVQRGPRYKLLLSELLDQTEEDHPDYNDIKLALDMIAVKTKAMNEEIRTQENKLKVEKINNNLIGGPRIISETRYFVREGQMMKVCRKVPKPRWFFLFSDCLIYTSSNAQAQGPPSPYQAATPTSYTFHRMMSLTDIKIKDLRDRDHQKNAFQIISSTEKSFTVYTETPKEKNNWLEDFKLLSMKIMDETESSGIHNLDTVDVPVWVPDKEATKLNSLLDLNKKRSSSIVQPSSENASEPRHHRESLGGTLRRLKLAIKPSDQVKTMRQESEKEKERERSRTMSEPHLNRGGVALPIAGVSPTASTMPHRASESRPVRNSMINGNRNDIVLTPTPPAPVYNPNRGSQIVSDNQAASPANGASDVPPPVPRRLSRAGSQPVANTPNPLASSSEDRPPPPPPRVSKPSPPPRRESSFNLGEGVPVRKPVAPKPPIGTQASLSQADGLKRGSGSDIVQRSKPPLVNTETSKRTSGSDFIKPSLSSSSETPKRTSGGDFAKPPLTDTSKRMSGGDPIQLPPIRKVSGGSSTLPQPINGVRKVSGGSSTLPQPVNGVRKVSGGSSTLPQPVNGVRKVSGGSSTLPQPINGVRKVSGGSSTLPQPINGTTCPITYYTIYGHNHPFITNIIQTNTSRKPAPQQQQQPQPDQPTPQAVAKVMVPRGRAPPPPVA